MSNERSVSFKIVVAVASWADRSSNPEVAVKSHSDSKCDPAVERRSHSSKSPASAIGPSRLKVHPFT